MSEEAPLSLLCPPKPALSCCVAGELTNPPGKAPASFIARFQHIFQVDPPGLALLQTEGFPHFSTLGDVRGFPKCAEVHSPRVGAAQLCVAPVLQRLFGMCRGKVQPLRLENMTGTTVLAARNVFSISAGARGSLVAALIFQAQGVPWVKKQISDPRKAITNARFPETTSFLLLLTLL